MQHLCGWRRDDNAVQDVLSRLPMPRFCDAAPHLAGIGEDKDGVPYLAYKKLFGKHMPAQKQDIGSCVSRGYSRGVDYLQCVQIIMGELEEFKFVSHAAVYGLARERGHMLGGGDGLVGAYAADSVSKDGTVSNNDANDSDTDDRLAKEWGARGCPSNIKQLAQNRLVKTVSQVTTPEEARDALVAGHLVPVCSDQGFTMTRDSNGKCSPRGSWGHCMVWTGYRADKRQFLIEQSWGQNCPDGPLGDKDIPDNGFWVDWDVAARMLSQRDSFVVSAYDGFPALPLDQKLFQLI